MLTISELFIYPIKSLGGIPLSSSLLTDRGLQYDRRWMLTDREGNFMTQRENATMALFDVAIKEDGLLVTHKIKGDAILIPFEPQTTATVMVDVWSDRCRAQPVSEEIDTWFSGLLSQECKLVYMPETTRRRVDGRYAKDKEITSFSDGYPSLLIGQSSLDELNTRLEKSVAINRFRPNIVFTGGEPYLEDSLEEFTINNISFFGVKLCGRCVVTTINPETAERGKEPLKTLASYRMRNNKVCFGQNLLHKGEGIIHVGDAIEVIRKKERPHNFSNAL